MVWPRADDDPKPRAVTGQDVARLAGVSQPTVSRVMRGQGLVSAETRQRVFDAAFHLGYDPQRPRTPAAPEPRHIAVVSTEWDTPFYPHLIAPVERALGALGCRTSLVTDFAEDHVLLAQLLDRSVDGVVLTTSSLESSLPQALSRRNVPTVLIHRVVDGVDADSCSIDNYYGGRLAGGELIAAGHRSAGFIGGPRNVNTCRDREDGFLSVFRQHDIPLPDSCIRRGPFTYDSGFSLVEDLLADHPSITAVFCANDMLALGAYSRLATLGRDVPGSVSLIGFDDVPMAGWKTFGLTTVKCDVEEMAHRGVLMLLDRIEHPERPFQRVILRPELVRRQTVGAARASAVAGPSSETESPSR